MLKKGVPLAFVLMIGFTISGKAQEVDLIVISVGGRPECSGLWMESL
jgi:hypothetical protein